MLVLISAIASTASRVSDWIASTRRPMSSVALAVSRARRLSPLGPTAGPPSPAPRPSPRGCRARRAGQVLDLVGDAREALARLAGPGRLDGGVQGQQVGLLGD